MGRKDGGLWAGAPVCFLDSGPLDVRGGPGIDGQYSSASSSIPFAQCYFFLFNHSPIDGYLNSFIPFPTDNCLGA